MKKWFPVFISLLVVFMFLRCQKEVGFSGGPDAGASITPDPIATSIQGNIWDENDQPASGVAVTAGTATAITDANGFFHISRAVLDKNTTLVTADKIGYYTGYRVMAATSGCNQIVIKLIKKIMVGKIVASSGGEVALSNGAKINLPPNSVVTASSNSAYGGDVDVYATYINPRSSDIGKIVPGSFIANDKNGKRVTLASYGMLAVELQSVGGEKLQIKTGSVATLTIPIPSSSISSAPATIPLWYVNEETGLWQEEGTATKQGNNYVGEVKHFSYWNCDYPYDGITLSFILQTPDGLPLVNALVEVAPTDSTGGMAHGYTDSLGQVKGLVPANKNLAFRVFNSCSNIIYSQSISALNKNSDLGTIKITAVNSAILTITGTLLDCSSGPVAKGYAILTIDGTTRYAATDASGRFTTTYVSCTTLPSSFTVLGVNEEKQQQGSVVTVPVASATVDAGSIAVCGVSSEQYMNYMVDNTDSYSISGSINDSATYGLTQSDSTFINATSQSDYIYFSASAKAAGTYPMNSFSISNAKYSSGEMRQPSNVTFTKFPASAGEFYEGSFTSTFTDSSGNHNTTGTFKIRRNQ